MKQAIIDIGSNSMRLTIYEIEGHTFRILFKEKIMAGLAGYVNKGILAPEGIACACTGLSEFRNTIDALHIHRVAAFATASLRNITNTAETVADAKEALGAPVEVISGKEEAYYGYVGAMEELDVDSGAFIDIGGASTELVSFDQRQTQHVASFHVGSLKLYRDWVKKIFPGASTQTKMEQAIAQEIDSRGLFPHEIRSPLVCVGGTARAMLKLAQKRYHLSPDCHSVTAEQTEALCAVLCRGDKRAINLILKLEPDQIHTMVPGLLILQHILRLFQANEILVSKYGVREGYLCQKILNASQIDMPIHKIAN